MKKTQNSQTPEEPKKNLKQTTSTSNMIDQCDVFHNALDSPDCPGILMNCL